VSHKWFFMGLSGAAVAIVTGILGFQAWLRADGNLHEVKTGEFYRSAQPTPEKLQGYIKQYGLKSVLNLRGSQPDDDWYRDEQRVTQSNGVQLIDFSMSAGKDLTRERALQLVEIMRNAPKPMLVHCSTGADRTGLVATIYAYKIAGMTEEEAEEQLSPGFGHFGIPLFSSTFAMDRSWEDMEKLFGIEGS